MIVSYRLHIHMYYQGQIWLRKWLSPLTSLRKYAIKIYIFHYFSPTTLKNHFFQKIRKTPADIDQIKKAISQSLNLSIIKVTM